MNKWHGFDKQFADFSRRHTPGSNFMRTLAVFSGLLLYTIVASAVLLLTRIINTRSELATLLHPLALTANLAGLTTNTAELATNTMGQLATQRVLFFRACVLAPTWEEVVFRVLPIVLAVYFVRRALRQEQILAGLKQLLGNAASVVLDEIPTPNLVLVIGAASSIIFGLGHGGPMNLLFQGVFGGACCWLFYKNNFSYASVVALHAIWNTFLIFGIRFLLVYGT